MKKKPLDDKDLKIINGLFKYGYKSSANFLSTKIAIPARTIAHRIKKLKARGYLRLYPGVVDSRLGLKGCFVLLQEKREPEYIAKILIDLPYAYLISSVYGKFTGIGAYFTFDSQSFPFLLNFLDLLVENDIIEKYYLFQRVEGGYVTEVNLINYNLTNLQWDWDFNSWLKEFKTHLPLIKDKPKRKFDLLSEIRVKFDVKDIKILKELLNIVHSDIETSSYSQHISKQIDLSAVQIQRRMNRLEQEGVLLFLINFQRAESEITTFILIFIELDDETNIPIIEYFFDSLPFQFDVTLGSGDRMCVFTYCNSRDFKWLLKSLDQLKSYTKEIFIEIIPFYYEARHHNYICWNEETNEWKSDYRFYINQLKRSLE